MDPLSDLLSLLRPRSYMFRGLDVGGQWSLRFPSTPGIRCYAILSGESWLIVEGAEGAVHLARGDCVLLTRRQSSVLASDTALTPLDAVAFLSKAPEGGVATVNDGGQLSGVGGYFDFAGKHAGVLLAMLPPVVHIKKESDRSKLRWSIEMMMQELREPEAGAALVAQHLGLMMLILAMRLYLTQGGKAGVGWLFALSDKQLGAAISAMHTDPAHRWTLQSLADRASMSRSTFALKFRESVGEPPMEYLVRWRMMLAADRLVHSSDSVQEIAYSLGYESDSAFSAAFRRVMGCSPRQYTDSDEADAASLGLSERVSSKFMR